MATVLVLDQIPAGRGCAGIREPQLMLLPQRLKVPRKPMSYIALSTCFPITMTESSLPLLDYVPSEERVCRTKRVTFKVMMGWGGGGGMMPPSPKGSRFEKSPCHILSTWFHVTMTESSLGESSIGTEISLLYTSFCL